MAVECIIKLSFWWVEGRGICGLGSCRSLSISMEVARCEPALTTLCNGGAQEQG